MRSAVTVTLLTALGASCACGVIARTSEASAVRRAYFRAASPEARARIAPFVTHEFPGGIVSTAAPAATVDGLAAAPGLTLVGYEALFHPAPIVTEQEITAGESRSQATAGTRACPLPGFLQPVGWGIKMMYDDPNLLLPSGGDGVKVAVIDGGVARHLDVVRRIARCMNFTPYLDAVECQDATVHGTMVASVIAADGGADGRGMYGMAPGAWIYSYQVCDPTDDCWGSYIAAGIYAAIADGVNIINLSLSGSGNDDVVHAAIQAAVAHNILVVVAAGNRPPFSYVGWPAAYPEVVSVGAITDTEAPWPYTVEGLNDGDYFREAREIEVAAPGASVLSALRNGCYVLASGTSLAAPMVAGLAAKLWNGSAVAARATLRASARLHDLYLPGDDGLTGFGLPTFLTVPAVIATAGPDGAVLPSGVVPVLPGSSQTFTIVPSNPCHPILDVTVDGASRGPISSYTFTDVTGVHTIDAAFGTLGPFAITAWAGAGGSITPHGIVEVTCQGNASFDIVATDDCHWLADVKVDGASKGPIGHFTFDDVTSPHAIEAVFAAFGPFVITASAEPGSTIRPSGASSVACGASQSYTIAPAGPCREIADVLVDGVSIGPASRYTFTDVRAAHTIAVETLPGLALTATHTDASGNPDGTIDLTVAGGVPPYAYAWSNGASSQDLVALAPGTYAVSVTDSHGCVAGTTVTIASLGPAEVALDRPAPNPGAGPVRLRFALPAPATVRLSVLDLRGGEVAVLARGPQPAGWREVAWNGETGRGRAPSGIYFFRLEASGRQIVQRFALVR